MAVVKSSSLSVLEKFLDACQSWNLEVVHNFVESGFLIDSFDDDHVTGLQMAAATGNIGIVEYLLDNGADIEKSNQVGMTPLHHACRNGHINVVRILIQRGANFHKLTYLGATTITLAAAGGHIELVKFLLDLRISINPVNTALCPTPIIAAAFRCHTSVCALLVHRGAHLNGIMQRMANLSALSTTISCGQTTMLSSLLELGANASFRSLKGLTAFELASSLENKQILDILDSKMEKKSNDEQIQIDLREKIMEQDKAGIGFVLAKKIPYIEFPDNTTPLMYAVLLADTPIIKLIIESGIDINMSECVSGLSALMLASIIGNENAIECLLNAGANVALVSHDGLTAVDYAFYSARIGMDIICRMQQQLEGGIPSKQVKMEQHPNISKVFQSSKAMILNKISIHVGSNLLNSSTNIEPRKESSREFFLKLLCNYEANTNNSFVLANHILRSVTMIENKDKADKMHNCIRLARYLAEMYYTRGHLATPIGLSLEEPLGNRSNSIYGKSDSSVLAKFQVNERRKEFFSVAQKNADLFYDGRQQHRTSAPESIKMRILDENIKKKSSGFSSISGSDGHEKLAFGPRFHSFADHKSSSALGTTPRLQKREFMNTNDENDDGKSSPSRLSLNQYTFALMEEQKGLRKSISTPSMTDVGRQKPSTKEQKKSTPSSLRGGQIFALPNNSVRRKLPQRITEDTIWDAMCEKGLNKYVEIFKSEEVDLATFLELTNLDLIDIGIKNALHRETILNIAKKMKKAKKN